MVLLTRVPDACAGSTLAGLGITSLREGRKDAKSFVAGTKWSTVSGFKGLESDVIILVGVENIINDWWRAICYVGMSLARSRLYVVLSSECEEMRRERWGVKLEQEYADRA